MMGKLININTASLTDLEKLPGIGRGKAIAIVEHRNIVSFESIQDLVAVEGITKTLINKLQEDHTLNVCDIQLPTTSKRSLASTLKRTHTSVPLFCDIPPDLLTPDKKIKHSDSDDESVHSPHSCVSLDSSISSIHPSCAIPGQTVRRRLNSTTCCSPLGLNTWLGQFQSWSRDERLFALNDLINSCDMSVVRHLMAKIEPHFQRDFISLLPKELALYVLSFLQPKDLCKAAMTCRYWRILAEDNLLWKEKCAEYDMFSSLEDTNRGLSKTSSTKLSNTPHKQSFLYCLKLETNWRSNSLRPAKYLKGHDDHVVTCLQFDGDKIVSASDDNTLKVWSGITGNLIRTLVGHTGGVWSSQLKGNIVVSGSTDRTLRVWNAETGECIHILQGHTSTVRCLAMHGDLVVSGSRDGTLRVWDVKKGVCLHVLIGHAAAVRCVQFDGKHVVSGAYDYLVKVWDVETETCLHTLSGHSNRVYSLQFDGTHIVSGSLDASIRVWNSKTGQLLHTLLGHQSLTSGMVLKNSFLVSGNADSTVKIWNIVTGKCLHTLTGVNKHNSAVTSLQFNSKFVVTSSDDGSVKLWDMKTGDFIRDLVQLESGGSGGVVWRVKCNEKKLVCAVGSRNGTEETKLLVIDFDVY